MNKVKKTKKFIAGMLVFAIAMAAYGFLPQAVRAVDSMQDASDTLTDSDVSVSAGHTITFTTNQTAQSADGDYVEVVFADEFGNITAGNSDCGGGNWNETIPNTETLRCAASGGDNAPGSYTFHATTTNPAATGSYLLTISHYNGADDVLKEQVQVRVAIVEDVTMTAHVDATLQFNISGVTSGSVVNGVTCSNDTSATSTDFGTLAAGASTTVCQALDVTTNASDGFVVTVQQDQEMTSDSGSNINSFNNSQDGTGSTTPGTWQSPSGILDVYNTYGHMGLTSDDADLAAAGYTDFTGQSYIGLDGAQQTVVFHHDGPADGSTASKGAASVAYTAEITALQEAGDYENTLTYIATPTF
jgi:hypothetical protein